MDYTVFLFILIGFFAQIIDGALGMAYGVTSTTFLLSMGISPAVASASVHTAEVFTSGVSGFSHFKFGNINKSLFKRLLIPGIIGGATGAYVLTSIPGETIKPFIAVYLLFMGIVIVRKALKKIAVIVDTDIKVIPLGLAGGFFDAIGGGGWGPIVTSTLVAQGHEPRFVIGSVNSAEFFVTVVQAAAFFILLGITHWQIIAGLLIGGVCAAPLGAYVCKKIPSRMLMALVGILIIILSIRTMYLTFIQ